MNQIWAGSSAYWRQIYDFFMLPLLTASFVLLVCCEGAHAQDKLHYSHEIKDFVVSSQGIVAVTANGKVWQDSVVLGSRKPGIAQATVRSALELPGSVVLASINPKGTLVAVYAGKATAVASVASGEILASSANIESRPQSIAVDDGASVLVGATDGKVYRWRFNEELLGSSQDLTFERYIGHASVVTSVAFHPLGRLLLSGDWVGQVNIWLRYDKDDFEGAYDRNRYPGRFYTDVPTKAKGAQLSDAIETIVVSRSGERFVTATRDGNLQVWLIRGLKKLGEVKAHDGSITAVALSEDGSKVASSGRDGSVRTWKVVENEDIKGSSIASFDAVGEATLPEQTRLQWGQDGQLLGARGDTISVITVKRVTPVPTP